VREGAHVTLVAHSISVGLIMDAAEILAKEGIEAELVDLRSLRPLDTATVIQSVKKTNRVVTVEQGWPICSIGSESPQRSWIKPSIGWTHRRCALPARMCRCLTRQILKSSRFPASTTSSPRQSPCSTERERKNAGLRRHELEKGRLPLRSGCY